jgi:hypothetical protein
MKENQTHSDQVREPRSLKILFGSLLVLAACLGMFSAEKFGFRVFDAWEWQTWTGKPMILSIQETIVVLGSLGLGAIAGLTALVSAAFYFKRSFRIAQKPMHED